MPSAAIVSRPAIRLERLSKAYLIGGRSDGRYQTLRETISNGLLTPWRRIRGGAGQSPPEPPENTLWALQDVSFDVAQGEVVGLIGRNGAGKSTLLKILSRITDPTSGMATLTGRVGSLLEVGTGFHMELTGRENVYLNGAVLGMSRREIARHFDEIVAFAEVDRLLDTPVKRYSSGMFVRLAFAVAAHLQTEILFIDEVLSVGDIEFQRKCLGKVGSLARSGRTILFVSHNLATVQNLCDRAILLERGQATADGPCAEVLGTYLRSVPGTAEGTTLALHRTPNSVPVMQRIALRDASGVDTRQFATGEGLSIEIEYEAPAPLRNPLFGITFESMTGERLFNLQSLAQYGPIATLPRRGTVTCHVPKLPLVPGEYALTIRCHDRHAPGPLDALERALTVQIAAADFFGTGNLPHGSHGRVLVPGHWSFTSEPGGDGTVSTDFGGPLSCGGAKTASEGALVNR